MFVIPLNMNRYLGELKTSAIYDCRIQFQARYMFYMYFSSIEGKKKTETCFIILDFFMTHGNC